MYLDKLQTFPELFYHLADITVRVFLHIPGRQLLQEVVHLNFVHHLKSKSLNRHYINIWYKLITEIHVQMSMYTIYNSKTTSLWIVNSSVSDSDNRKSSKLNMHIVSQILMKNSTNWNTSIQIVHKYSYRTTCTAQIIWGIISQCT